MADDRTVLVYLEGENGVGSLNGQVHSFDSADGPSQEDSRLLQFLDKLTGPGGERQPPAEELTLVQRVLSLRLHIAALAVLVSWLTFWDYDFLFAQSIFIPLIMLELPQLMLLQATASKRTEADIIGVALLLCGLSPPAVTRIRHWVYVLKSVFLDILVYFLSYWIFHVALESGV
uniref:Uncharacterized protein n=1 Tax=Timema douglasi TaxID=61478 RepID=A0A7R8ZF74_TIMDO|nr:unnamed protein product [Timema douglasi]